MIDYIQSTPNETTLAAAIQNFSAQEIEKLNHFSKIFESIIFEDLEKVLKNREIFFSTLLKNRFWSFIHNN